LVQAWTVDFDPNQPDAATGITNLDIGGTIYNVAFISQTTAVSLYGEAPGVYDFTTNPTAGAAVDAVNAALTLANVEFVGSGAVVAPATRIYDVGFNFVPIGKIKGVQVWEGTVGSETAGTWIRPTDTDLLSYTFDERTYADFTVAGADTEAAE
jgi:hypothetical protein